MRIIHIALYKLHLSDKLLNRLTAVRKMGMLYKLGDTEDMIIKNGYLSLRLLQEERVRIDKKTVRK